MVPARAEILARQGRCAPLVLVAADLPLGTVIEDVLLLNEFSIEADWAAEVIHLSLG